MSPGTPEAWPPSPRAGGRGSWAPRQSGFGLEPPRDDCAALLGDGLAPGGRRRPGAERARGAGAEVGGTEERGLRPGKSRAEKRPPPSVPGGAVALTCGPGPENRRPQPAARRSPCAWERKFSFPPGARGPCRPHAWCPVWGDGRRGPRSGFRPESRRAPGWLWPDPLAVTPSLPPARPRGEVKSPDLFYYYFFNHCSFPLCSKESWSPG